MLQGRILVILSFSAAREAEKGPMLAQERAGLETRVVSEGGEGQVKWFLKGSQNTDECLQRG